MLRQIRRQLQQPVGLAAHRRHDDDELVPPLLVALDARGDVPDPVDGADRGAAVLLDNECHWSRDSGSDPDQIRLKTSVLLVPPKPNAFDSATSIFIGRAVSGT